MSKLSMTALLAAFIAAFAIACSTQEEADPTIAIAPCETEPVGLDILDAPIVSTPDGCATVTELRGFVGFMLDRLECSRAYSDFWQAMNAFHEDLMEGYKGLHETGYRRDLDEELSEELDRAFSHLEELDCPLESDLYPKG